VKRLFATAVLCGACAALGWPLLTAHGIEPAATTTADRHGDAAERDIDSAAEIIGRRAPAWRFTRWVRGAPAGLDDLRGKVVLLRWWTEGCHYCEATLPALEALRRKHEPDGLVVIGVFHPKPPREISNARILRVAKRLGFSGPISLDRDWKTLEAYWLGGHPERSWTSVSFLIDRDGVIRWVHGGGEYHASDDPLHARCGAQLDQLESALAAALEPSGPGGVRSAR
jgi:thiol-disulfide isomerase/thioredoxin